ncbi:MAG TPA: aldehyde dehydrogenase family protein, partial [Gemmatimonadales bacterium]|nr:aldehyde dehydrogenase family protein [Gemmatimonadales bacterium]
MLDAILKPPGDGAASMAPALLAGEWLGDGSAERVGPYVRRVVSRARLAGPGDPARAADYACVAKRHMARLAPAARAEILERAAGIAVERRDDFARLIALELGKPIKDGRGEMDRVGDTLAVCAAEARQIGGELLPVAGWRRGIGNTAMTYRAPAGVALAIT